MGVNYPLNPTNGQSFTYTDPATSTVYTFTYTGTSPNGRWSVSPNVEPFATTDALPRVSALEKRVPALRDYGAVGDGTTNDTAAINAAIAANPGGVVLMEGKTYRWVVASLPDFTTSGATLFFGGSFTIGNPSPGSTIDMGRDPDGALISYNRGAGLELGTRDRALIAASDRVTQVKDAAGSYSEGSNVAAIASSRVYQRGLRTFAAGTETTDIGFAFSVGAIGNRYCEASGERSFVAASLLSRIWGQYPITDYQGRWGLPADGGPFAGTNQPTPVGSTFYTGMIAAAATEIRSGTSVFAAATKGVHDSGDSDFKSTTPVILKGTCTWAIGARSTSSVDGVLNGLLSAHAGVISDTAGGCVIAAAEDCSVPAGRFSAIVGANNSDINAPGSSGPIRNNLIGGSYGASIRNALSSAVIGGTNVYSSGSRSVVAAGRGGENVSNDVLAIMYTTAAKPATPTGSNQARKIVLEATSGIGRFAGGTTTSGLDFAEYMENLVPGAIEPGHVLVREGRKVAIGVPGDTRPLAGVLSARPTIIGGDGLEWGGKYVQDEWGRDLEVDVAMIRWPDQTDETEAVTLKGFDGRVEDLAPDAVIPDAAERYTLRDKVVSDGWTPGVEYRFKSERPEEWSPVGYLGQIRVRTGEAVAVGDYVGPGGLKTDREGIVVMEVLNPYDADAGYGVALCFVAVHAAV
ncbi:hypothetical protein GCM10008171_34480 [Methylopila jiangsuensis]|uniref:Pectate lyase superfamily protein domain-containing protein n=1 Tax=Methylopila jiangsuensis TaxID=586230 RepID=A0A9W6JL89_9HYPH|nr:peptidase G2 autoproteolytic cleavage domain-containing protein [Methylopila jiangsuensis]MDR6284421.1 hypothetical protein [Methylopila jiangsuensis]GLK78194.1 hypothetical protein GCM10008171_34480 [Methylopila jiangsuensis]